MSEGMADIPEESNVDTESDGVGLGKYENYSDGDRDKEDYSDGITIKMKIMLKLLRCQISLSPRKSKKRF